MATYYVTHPNIDLSAVVHAPSTDRARTVLLDFLERSNLISRAHRGAFRENMVAKRLTDPHGIAADVELHYLEQEVWSPIPLRDPSPPPDAYIEEDRASLEAIEEAQKLPRSPLEAAQMGPVRLPIRLPIQEASLGLLRKRRPERSEHEVGENKLRR